MKTCVIIDYGLCNLLSVHNALRYLGVVAQVSSRPADLQAADCAILPGVGAFADGMKGLRQHGLDTAIKDYVRTGRPLLGICLGMELLLSKSCEFGEHVGLDLIPGEVLPFQTRKEDDVYSLKVPHIGWNGLRRGGADWTGTPLAGLPDGSEMYFVHSFFVRPEDSGHILAKTEYGAENFCSVVRRDNICGCQFHPEKSSVMGLKILSNFINADERVEVKNA